MESPQATLKEETFNLPRKERTTMTKCRNPHCEHTKVVRRGLCNACYQFIGVQIRKGKLNMKQLEAQGKVLGVKKKSLQAKNAWFFSADNN